MKIREFVVVLLLGFFIGLCAGYWVGHKEAINYLSQVYEKEVVRLESWNKVMLNTMVNMLGKKK